MQTRSGQTPRIEAVHQDAGQYLARLHMLIHELHLSMDAIANRSLPELEESISRQLFLCSRLSEASFSSTAHLSYLGASSSTADSELAQRISSATGDLIHLNKCYSRLLQHSGDTVRLLQSLCSSYSGQAQRDSPIRWSCEL